MPIRIVTAAQISPDYQIVDARSERAFRRGHLPGSRWLHWKDFTDERPGLWNLCFGHPRRWGRLAKGPEIESRLQEMGLDQDRPILVIGSPGERGAEGRTAWNLLYWGARSVALLNGGYRPPMDPSEERGSPRPVARGSFRVTLRAERMADGAEVLRAMEKRDRALLDVRTEVEFHGRRAPGQKRGGHIPGATLIPFRSLYEKDGSFATAETLSRLVPPPAERPIAYCTGGVRSALLAVLLEARLGIVTANYDGSLWEWSANSGLPLQS